MNHEDDPARSPNERLEQAREATAERILRVFSWSTFFYVVLFLSAGLVQKAVTPTRLLPGVVALVGAVGGLALLALGRRRLGRRVTSAIVAWAIVFVILRNGGVDAPAFHVSVPFCVAMLFLHGMRTALVTAFAFVLCAIGAAWGKASGLIPPIEPVPVASRVVEGGLDILFALAVSAVPLRVLTSSLAEAAEQFRISRENERRFEVLSQAAFEAVVVSDRGVVLEANDQLATLLGYTRAELLGKPIVEMIAPEFRELILERIRREEETVLAHRLLRKDGSPVPVESRARKIPFKGRLVRVTAIRDMTEKLKAEADLRLSEERLRLALQGARMGIWVWDVRADAIDHPSLVPGLYGGEPPANEAQLLDLIGANDREAAKRALAECRRGVRDVYESVHRIRRRDDAGWLEFKGRLFRDAKGQPERLAGTVVDVTERMRAEEEIRTLNLGLERKVAERTMELSASNRELEAFAYTVSHDLRAPLRAIDGFARALGEDVGPSLGSVGEAHLARIHAATQRMDELILSLLELSRIARTEVFRVKVDVSALALSIGAELERANPDRRMELVVDPGLEAEADALLLRVALTNLLSNAWKFTSKTAAPRVEVGRVRDARGVLSFFVRDNGVGFDLRYASKLFGPFQRLHPAKDYPGTGIGLATVQRVITRHGGSIEAESEPGRGATFSFTLSARPDQST
jgi:PAS domain S-box-containing protein